MKAHGPVLVHTLCLASKFWVTVAFRHWGCCWRSFWIQNVFKEICSIGRSFIKIPQSILDLLRKILKREGVYLSELCEALKGIFLVCLKPSQTVAITQFLNLLERDCYAKVFKFSLPHTKMGMGKYSRNFHDSGFLYIKMEDIYWEAL